MVLSACSGVPAGSSTVDAATTISISGFAYTVPESVAPGATVTVVNADTDAHSVTSDPAGEFDATVSGKSDTTFAAPTRPGNYPFYCKFHRYMKATLVVR